MKIHYTCECCGAPIDTLEVERVDEARLGFDCLTGEERRDIIKVDSLTNTIYVQSLCDACIEELGLTEEPVSNYKGTNLLH
ncbi:MAG: anti-sigma-F factor Fin [Veillonellales bacterium]|jgi:hypothetical protein